MKQLASPELYQTLLEGESSYDLPKSWSVNVREVGGGVLPALSKA
jgi:hypothetical protein